MEIKTVTITYGVKRSRNYQSADVSMTTEVSVEEGEVMGDVFKTVMERMIPLVDTEAHAAINAVAGD